MLGEVNLVGRLLDAADIVVAYPCLVLSLNVLQSFLLNHTYRGVLLHLYL